MLCLLLDVILDAQYVSYFNLHTRTHHFYKLVLGIFMGSNCSVELANLYLLRLDDAIKSLAGVHLYGYCRFVDDILIAVQWAVAFDDLLRIANTIIPGICCKLAYYGLEDICVP